MPLDLTPLVSGAESLTPVARDIRTMVPLSGGTETLTPEEGLHPTPAIFTPGTLPGPNTFPGGEDEGELFPDDNESIPAMGLELDPVTADAVTLTPLQED